VFTFTDVMDLFPNKFPGLRGRSLPLALVAPRAVDRFFVGHKLLLFISLPQLYFRDGHRRIGKSGD
jgi:hypothetical protein